MQGDLLKWVNTQNLQGSAEASGQFELLVQDRQNSVFVNFEPTLERELGAMQFGESRWPSAKGRLVYHEYQVQAVARFDNPMPAWKILLGRFDD